MMDTIYALSSGYGKSGVAIFRISGTQSSYIAKSILLKLPKPRIANLCKFYRPQSVEILDTGIALWFPGPNSFTGEDCLELHCHGSMAVIKAISDVLSQFSDVRLAEAGEFSRRSFLNGKMDLTEIEGLSDLLAAETELQRKQAVSQSSGKIRCKADEWRNDLLRAMALLEASIDFSDEGDVSNTIIDVVKSELEIIAIQWQNALQGAHFSERLREGFSVVLTGAPNSGKSSLLNAIVGRNIAIISSTPGTTRDIIEAYIDIEGLPVKLVDTAGLRDSNDDIEQEGIRRALEAIKSADLVLHLYNPLDTNATLTSSIFEYDQDNCVSVATHSDLITQDIDLSVSALTGQGIDDLIGVIRDRLIIDMPASEMGIITRKRHLDCFENAYKDLCDALQTNFYNSPELAAEFLRSSSFHLARLSGRIVVEDLLDFIFREFCIGK